MVKKVKALFEEYRPKRWYSWQTSIWLSGISGGMSILARLGNPGSLVSKLLASFGWFFLIVGVSWLVKEERSTLAPWITSAVVCMFFFGSWNLGNWESGVMVWPVVAALIYALPYFWDDSFQRKLPDTNERISILLILGSQLLLSFWFQFFFVLSDFIEEYPSYYSDDLSESLFVVRSPNREAPDPRGVFVLELLDLEIQERYENRLWSEVDAELNRPPVLVPRIRQLLEEVRAKTAQLKEDEYWSLADPYAIDTVEPGKELVLEYLWEGSRAQEEKPYIVEKVCDFRPIANPDPLLQGNVITQVECRESKVFGWLSDDEQ